MPFPFIIGAVVVAAEGLGLAGHVSAKEKNEKAQRICENAKYNYDQAKAEADKKFAAVNEGLRVLGQEKLEIIRDSVSKFKYSFNKIKHVSDLFEHGKELSFNISSFSEKNVDSLVSYGNNLANIASKSAESNDNCAFIGAIAGPGIAAGVAGVSALVSGGVVAGMGAAATAVLCSPLAMVAAPLFMVHAFKADSEADKNLDKARTYESEVNVEIEKLETQSAKFSAIINKTKIYSSLLKNLRNVFDFYVNELQQIVTSHQSELKMNSVKTDIFTQEELKKIYASFTLCQSLDSLMHTPIFDENGDIHSEFNSKIDSIKHDTSKFQNALE
jgi:hypothetical protein